MAVSGTGYVKSGGIKRCQIFPDKIKTLDAKFLE